MKIYCSRDSFSIMAADTTAARSIVKMKIDEPEDKIEALSFHLLMAYSREPGKFNLIMPVFCLNKLNH